MKIQDINVEEMRRHPANRKVNEEHVARLAASIRTNGVLEPLIVRVAKDEDTPEEFEILSGEHRWLAAQKAGLVVVPCQVRNLDDRAALEMILVPNLERLDLDPLEEADGVRALVAAGVDVDELIQRIHRSREWVQLRLALGDLPPPMREAVRSRSVSLAVAAEVLRVPDDRREDAIQMVLHPTFQPEPLSAEQARATLEKAIHEPQRRADAWRTGAAKRLKDWKARLAPMEKAAGGHLQLEVMPWDFSAAKHFLNSVYENTDGQSEACPIAGTLLVGELAAHHNARVMIVPRHFMPWAILPMDEAWAAGSDSVALVDTDALGALDDASALPWLASVPAMPTKTRDDHWDAQVALADALHGELIAAMREHGPMLEVGPWCYNRNPVAMEMCMDAILGFELDSQWAHEVAGNEDEDPDKAGWGSLVAWRDNTVEPPWPLTAMLWGHWLGVRAPDFEGPKKLRPAVRERVAKALEVFGRDVHGLASALPMLAEVAGREE